MPDHWAIYLYSAVFLQENHILPFRLLYHINIFFWKTYILIWMLFAKNKISFCSRLDVFTTVFIYFPKCRYVTLPGRCRNMSHWVTINPLTPNDPYMGRTAPLTSKRCILYIYSTNTEYFKHALYSPFFSSKCSLFHNANFFGSCIIHILYTECAEIKKK